MLIETESGQVTFEENTKGKIIGTGKVGKNSSSCIDDVMLIEGLCNALVPGREPARHGIFVPL